MSYVVHQRTREIGTRIALGGTAAGLLVGLAATRSLTSILYGVSSSDPATLGASAAILVATIMAACYLPARRAASVEPASTLSEL